MSDPEEEIFPFFGTPLEPIEEDEVPRKKPIPVQDQIATDKQGRRRFHGAFTGGFSAGFYNTVSTPEGWLPAPFKSSRTKKFGSLEQRPEDFMDDEDTEEFGIAPSVLRAKPEYSGSSRSLKRERVIFSDGPIPGEPVLQKILEPAKETIGVLLLMKMGWKPGQGIGPRLTKLQKKLERRKNREKKIIGCALGPDSDSDGDDDIDVNQLFAPDDTVAAFLEPKTDRFGMGYTGLDKTASVLGRFELIPKPEKDTFRMLDKNKKLAIRGQAFGVGAFEEDDEDIYAKDDMARYDFALESLSSLKEKRKREKDAKQLLAITSGHDCIEGFVLATKRPPLKKYFPPPKLPPDFQPYHSTRKTRFGPEHPNLPSLPSNKPPVKQVITADDRAQIIGEKSRSETKDEGKKIVDTESESLETKPNNEKIVELSSDTLAMTCDFRPFISDPPKQNRYERYLHFIKIGAKEAFSSIQPKTMSEWEKERERSEFEQAAKLYQPLSGLMAERFAHAELPDDATDPLAPVKRTSRFVNPQMEEAVREKKFGKLTRVIEVWAPSSLLCKRMNIAEPTDDCNVTLAEVAKTKQNSKTSFSVFDFLADGIPDFDRALKPVEKNSIDFEKEDSKKTETPQSPNSIVHPNERTENEKPVVQEKSTHEEAPRKPLKLPTPKSNMMFEDPKEKKDLFKAIFCSSEEESESEEDTQSFTPMELNKDTPPVALRNTSPPRGIFANLDLDKFTVKPSPSAASNNNATNSTSNEGLLYGPTLPTKPLFVPIKKPLRPPSPQSSSSDSSNENVWIEKNDDRSKLKHKKKKRNKDSKSHRHNKDKKKDRHKHKKNKKDKK